MVSYLVPVDSVVKTNNRIMTGVVRLFARQSDWFDQLRTVRWQDLPHDAVALPRYKQLRPTPHLLVCHWFSGRRRLGDFHQCMVEWGRRKGIQVTVLSADTAVNEYYGNLAPGASARQALEDCYAHRVVGATLCGPPCETYSEARHHHPEPPPEPPAEMEEGAAKTVRQRPWPRPLRSRDWIAGLEDLTMREMRQVRMGSFFFRCCSS